MREALQGRRGARAPPFARLFGRKAKAGAAHEHLSVRNDHRVVTPARSVRIGELVVAIVAAKLFAPSLPIGESCGPV